MVDCVDAGARRVLTQAIERSLARNRDNLAVVDADSEPPQATTYGQLAELVDLWRTRLRGIGLAAARPVALRANYSAESVALAVAAILEGGRFCWLDPRGFVGVRLLQALTTLQPVVTATDIAGLPDPWGQSVPLSMPSAPRLSVRVHPGTPSEQPAPTPVDDAAYILFTSGSTGQPKGVVMSAEALLARVEHHCELYELTPDDRLLSLTAIGTQVAFLFAALVSGGLLHVQTSRVLRNDVGDAIRSARITGLFTTPTMWTIGARGLAPGETFFGDTPSLRFVNIGTGALPPSLLRDVIARTDPHLAFHTGYGQSETGRVAFLANLHHPENLARVGCAGRAVSGCRILIARDRETLAPTGEAGEIIVAGKDIMSGYLDDDALTDEKLGTHAALGDARVVYTGDHGLLDEAGYLYFRGRSDSMIKVAGYRIYPREVEEVLARHEHVREAVAFGIPDPLRGGEQLVAVVLATPGTDVRELRQFMTGKVPRQFVPKHVEIWPELPRTNTGKPAVVEIKSKFLRER